MKILEEIKRRVLIVILGKILVVLEMINRRDIIYYVLCKRLKMVIVEVEMFDILSSIVWISVIVGIVLSIPIVLVNSYSVMCGGMYRRELKVMRRIGMKVVRDIILVCVLVEIYIRLTREMLVEVRNCGVLEVQSIGSIGAEMYLVKRVVEVMCIVLVMCVLIERSVVEISEMYVKRKMILSMMCLLIVGMGVDVVGVIIGSILEIKIVLRRNEEFKYIKE